MCLCTSKIGPGTSGLRVWPCPGVDWPQQSADCMLIWTQSSENKELEELFWSVFWSFWTANPRTWREHQGVLERLVKTTKWADYFLRVEMLYCAACLCFSSKCRAWLVSASEQLAGPMPRHRHWAPAEGTHLWCGPVAHLVPLCHLPPGIRGLVTSPH